MSKKLYVIMAVCLSCLLFAGCKKIEQIELPDFPDEIEVVVTPEPTPAPPITPSPEPTPEPTPTPTPVPTPEPTPVNITEAFDTYTDSDKGLKINRGLRAEGGCEIYMTDYDYPVDILVQGQYCSVFGRIQCDIGTITEVKGELIKNDMVMQESVFNPNLPYFSIGGTINEELHFSKLAKGVWTYRLSVKAEYDGIITEGVLVEKTFQVIGG